MAVPSEESMHKRYSTKGLQGEFGMGGKGLVEREVRIMYRESAEHVHTTSGRQTCYA